MKRFSLLFLVAICYTCEAQLANSLIKEGMPIKTDLHDIDTTQVISKSDSFFIRGKYFYDKQEYRKAIECFFNSDSVISVHLGDNSPYYGYGKIWVSSCFYKLGMDSIAMKYSNYYDKQPIDKLLTHSSDSVVWIALKMIELGQISNAAEKLLEAARMEKEELGPNNYWYANTLSNCAGLYSDIGNFEKAIEIGKEAVEIYKATFGANHLNYSTCLSNLAACYSLYGNDFIAIQLYKESLGIRKNNIGTESPEYVNDLSNLAESYSSIGNYPEALRLGKEAMNIRKKIFGTDHPDYALSLILIASYHSAIGNYPEALRLGTEAREIFKKVLGSTHPYYATTLYRLASYYSNVGNYTKALQLSIEAMTINKDIFGIEHPQYATSLSSVALYNSYLGKYAEALKIGKEVLELDKKIFGVDHPEYAVALACLASYYSNIGNYSEAIVLGNKALDIYQKVYSSVHPGCASILNNLADYNAYLGNYSEALLLGKEAMVIVNGLFGTDHPNYALSLRDISSYYSYMGNFKEAYSYLKEFIESSQPYIFNNFVELSSNLRESLWTGKFALYYNNVFPSVVEKYKNKETISELYDKTCLFAKGILLTTDMEMRKLIFESGDSLLITKYKNLSSNISIYNKLIETPIDKRLINADSLNNVIQRQEVELVKESKAYGDYTHNLTINWKDVQRRLGDNDIAIEFLDFPVFNTDSIVYVALTLKKDYDSPHMVTLFEEKQLKAIPSDVYYTQTNVSDLVWKPLEEELKGVKNIYFAPSGELHRIGIEYLPISKTENINEVYTLHRLSSTRQLAIIQDETQGKNSILYGGLNYDEKTSLISTDSSYTKESVNRNAYTYRANVDSLSLRNSFEYLEGTKREADQIAEDMKQHGVPYFYYSGTEGTEESFKKLDGTKPKVMHIATHGFYFSEEEVEKSRIIRPEMVLLADGSSQAGGFVEYKPMTRSGLLFSGCNRIIHHEQIPDGDEDGILTAQEISTLDLRGLDLVVLSACQTGLGDIISGEGVFGLQRGFKKAGAKTIIMSLWNVNDESTMKMMTSFYHYYLEGMPKEEAFHAAQNELRKDNSSQQERPDWASFIMLDGLK